MTRKKVAIGITVWLGIGLANFGFINADLQHGGHYIAAMACNSYRHDLSFAMGWSLSLGPIGALLAPFLTGFYQYGWRLSPRADCGV